MTAAPGLAGRAALELQRRSLLALQSMARKLSRRKPLPPHLQVGLRGELEALFFLRRLGFQVVERRWRSPHLNGDLDLIAWEFTPLAPTLAIVEVKARTARDLVPAAFAVDREKRRMLERMARAYQRTLPRAMRDELTLRFDIVSVYLLPTGIECELLRGIDVEDHFPRRGV